MGSIESILGDRLVAENTEVRPHVQVDEVLALARDVKADAIVGMGGGSPIGMVKAVASWFGVQQGGSSQPLAQCPKRRERHPDQEESGEGSGRRVQS